MKPMFNNLRVQKYGGSSLDSTEKIQNIARQIAKSYQRGDRFLIVVSAMGKTTNDLFEKAHTISKNPKQRELDMLLTAGERISIALMSLALNDLNVPAISFTGSQAGIMTCGTHGDASILDVKPIRVIEELKNDKVVVIAGFQGVDPQTKDVTTLGRGGSDTTAIAMAAHFGCSQCEFKKDTEGVFSKDPNQFPDAEHLSELTWDQTIELTKKGANFLHLKAAKLAKEMQMPLVISHAHKPEGLYSLIK